MPNVITNLCEYDGSCTLVCPVDCIIPGKPVGQYPQYYIDPISCIDCGACIAECDQGAIFEEDMVPSAYEASGGERLTMPVGTPGFDEPFENIDVHDVTNTLPATRLLVKGEIIDLTPSIEANDLFFTDGPGYDVLN